MKRIVTLSYVFILLALGFMSPQVLAMNEDDLIWEAHAMQNGVHLMGKYKESPENGLLDQTLEVQIEDAPANVTLFIAINGRTIGSMTTDAFGRADFRRDKFGVRPGDDGRPLGPRIETGDVLRVFRGRQGIEAEFLPI